MGLDLDYLLGGDDDFDIDDIMSLSKKGGHFPEWIFIINNQEYNLGKRRTANVYLAAKHLAEVLQVKFVLKQIRFGQPSDYDWCKYKHRSSDKFEQFEVENILEELGYKFSEKKAVNNAPYDLYWNQHPGGRMMPLKQGILQEEAEKITRDSALAAEEKTILFSMKKGESDQKEICAFSAKGNKL